MKRKELYCNVRKARKVAHQRQLLLGMKGQWSFAYVDECQQSLSLEGGPCLHYATPALEGLHKAGSARIEKPRYSPGPFRAAIQGRNRQDRGIPRQDWGYQYLHRLDVCVTTKQVYSFHLMNLSSQTFYRTVRNKKYWSQEFQLKAEAAMEQVVSSSLTCLGRAASLITRVALCTMYEDVRQYRSSTCSCPALLLEDDKVTAPALWLGVGLWGLADRVGCFCSGCEAVARRTQKMSRHLRERPSGSVSRGYVIQIDHLMTLY